MACISFKYREENQGATQQGCPARGPENNDPTSDSDLTSLGAIYPEMLGRARSNWLGKHSPLVEKLNVNWVLEGAQFN